MVSQGIKRPDTARPNEVKKSKCHRLHERVLQFLGWRLAAGIAYLPRCQDGRTNLPRIQDHLGHCGDLEVVQLASAEFAG